jgi:hypothetical protein
MAAVFLAALICGAYRLHPRLAGVLCLALFLVAIMAWFKWSDVVMSVCTLLFFATLFLVSILP